jgi:hypothetical protein
MFWVLSGNPGSVLSGEFTVLGWVGNQVFLTVQRMLTLFAKFKDKLPISVGYNPGTMFTVQKKFHGSAMTDPNERFDSIVKKLKENHHKLTPQRLAVVKILAPSDGHPNVEKIYAELQDDFPTMSLATV